MLAKPAPFLQVRHQRLDLSPTLCGLCVGYETGQWRVKQLADHMMEWLPEYALSGAELSGLQHANAVALLRRAASSVYQTKKFQNRGEFGELFLHAIIRQVHDSLPAISKIYYKTAVNDTVKGFDAVHVVGPPDDMELWLGEAKFYDNISAAIADVIKELELHLGTNYLKNEFMLLTNKIDDSWPHSVRLKKLLSPNTSLDEVFKRACIPVLLTYDSTCLTQHKECTTAYIESFAGEMKKHYNSFVKSLSKKVLPAEVRLHLFLLPLQEKGRLVEALDTKLRIWQQL